MLVCELPRAPPQCGSPSATTRRCCCSWCWRRPPSWPWRQRQCTPSLPWIGLDWTALELEGKAGIGPRSWLAHWIGMRSVCARESLRAGTALGALSCVALSAPQVKWGSVRTSVVHHEVVSFVAKQAGVCRSCGFLSLGPTFPSSGCGPRMLLVSWRRRNAFWRFYFKVIVLLIRKCWGIKMCRGL
jgi:hypothetical protein